MNSNLVDVLGEICENEDIEYEKRTDYSGRGMFGKTTGAIVINCSLNSMLAAVVNNASLLIDSDGVDLFNIPNIKSDSMGMGTILY